ncbi:MAG: hypothetical protein AB7E83_07715 [Ramlibacter sp.]
MDPQLRHFAGMPAIDLLLGFVVCLGCAEASTFWTHIPINTLERQILYSCTVLFCDVYPLRRDGVKLPAEAVQAGKRAGWLRLARPRMGPPIHEATLTDDGRRELLIRLTCVTVLKIDKGGILLTGFLDNGRSAHPVRQSWWCVPQPHGWP